jgi:osmotically-inducible protein OsmY
MAIPDEKIKKDIVDRVYWDSRLDASDIKVEVSNGHVTLSGSVPSYTARQAAMDNAGVTPGVVFIKNELTVKHPVIDDIPRDEDVKERIEKLLLWNPSVNHASINVSVARGVVILEGSVDALWKKLRCEYLVSDVTGVVEVVNKLAVVPTESILDKSIADTIVKALDGNPSLDAKKIDVKVIDGQVQLSGAVPDWAGLTAARIAASYTRGVREVITDLTLEGR